jgi:hypothetical protein
MPLTPLSGSDTSRLAQSALRAVDRPVWESNWTLQGGSHADTVSIANVGDTFYGYGKGVPTLTRAGFVNAVAIGTRIHGADRNPASDLGTLYVEFIQFRTRGEAAAWGKNESKGASPLPGVANGGISGSVQSCPGPTCGEGEAGFTHGRFVIIVSGNCTFSRCESLVGSVTQSVAQALPRSRGS